MNQSHPYSGDDPSGHDAINIDAFARICKALGHPARVRIVQHLRATDSCICGKLVDILPLAQSTVSQHLKRLKAAGLILGSVEGPRTCYCLNREVLEGFRKMLDRMAL